jgi:hypothetical protein
VRIKRKGKKRRKKKEIIERVEKGREGRRKRGETGRFKKKMWRRFMYTGFGRLAFDRT